jgi:hypothetical protein
MVTDGYSEIYDQFYINISKIPFSFVFTLVIQVLGPIIGIFGLWKYRYIFYNIKFDHNYIYSTENIYIGLFFFFFTFSLFFFFFCF